MTNEQLRRLVFAKPFRRLYIHLVDGREIRINHPEFLATHPAGRTVIVLDDDERFEVVDVLHITSIEVRGGSRAR